MKDTQEELERLEQELLADETQQEEETANSDEALLEEIIAEYGEPVGADSALQEDAVVYSNYTSDYGEDLQNFAETGETAPEKKDDKLIIGLMITASILCAGIIGILIYWLNAFLS